MAKRKGALEPVRADASSFHNRRNRVNFFELADERIEDLLVKCESKPGRFPDRRFLILGAFAYRRGDRAVSATDTLIDFMDTMFDGMESGVDPSPLDCCIEPLLDARTSRLTDRRGERT